ncbi:helix-turn-helix transcriptional regulator [Aerococcaceae bacterium zg-ZJ1578]|uniref:helix-turn-helix transcriptional regulator n=1 Tax=Aerococcaceae bacterium zg-252 TaxID=2796928 RepID=UPI001A1DA7E8|nr:helix-turn-helix transcriptional regulator [Aerococcaceae bacterium zg-1578]MBS4460978.1 helix-turn-helix transcriptional regulator [Aerococcaceae bacterium zg-B36]
MDKFNFFKSMILFSHHLEIISYDMNGTPSTDNSSLLNIILNEDELVTAAINKAKITDKPFILSNSINLTWFVDIKLEEKLKYIYFLGPIFLTDSSSNIISSYAQKMSLPFKERMELEKYIKSVPITPILNLLQIGLMLHYTLTQEKISLHDIFSHNNSIEDITQSKINVSAEHSAWIVESQIMSLVEEGNTNFKKKLNDLSLNINVGKLSENDSLRQAKNMTLASIVLVSRAAIKGGLHPSIAYPLSDYYFRSTENCHTISELTNINNIMMEDFVNRVHQIKEYPLSNKHLLLVKEYIDSHLDTPLSIDKLSQLVNYSPYYLSRKFKTEFNIDITQYIRNARLEYSKNLLRYTNLPIQEISSTLHFTSPSYFTKLFKKHYNCTPKIFREKFI